jgi:ketosteroid isomerase-like protein
VGIFGPARCRFSLSAQKLSCIRTGPETAPRVIDLPSRGLLLELDKQRRGGEMPEHLTAEQRLGIFDLLADYAHRLEGGDLDGYLETFTPDGVFEARSGRYAGREAIRAIVAHLYEIGQDGPGGNRHVLSIPHVTGTPEGCTAETYVLIINGSNGASEPIRAVAQYQDRIVWHEGRWRFAHRRIAHVFGWPVSSR